MTYTIHLIMIPINLSPHTHTVLADFLFCSFSAACKPANMQLNLKCLKHISMSPRLIYRSVSCVSVHRHPCAICVFRSMVCVAIYPLNQIYLIFHLFAMNDFNMRSHVFTLQRERKCATAHY